MTQEQLPTDLNWQIQQRSPTLIEGPSAPAYLEAHNADVKVNFNKNPNLDVLALKDGLVVGANHFVATRLDARHAKEGQGIRVATLADLTSPEVFDRFLANKAYGEAPALIVQSENDSYTPNKAILKDLLPLVEESNGRVQFPFVATGFDYEYAPNRSEDSYGLRLVARSDFKVIHDERLSESGKKFNTTDEQGLPEFEKKGKFTWYSKSNGVSGLYVYRDGCVGASNGNLVDSDDYGRVVLVRGAAAQEKFLDNLARDYEQAKSELESRYAKARDFLQGKE